MCCCVHALDTGRRKFIREISWLSEVNFLYIFYEGVIIQEVIWFYQVAVQQAQCNSTLYVHTHNHSRTCWVAYLAKIDAFSSHFSRKNTFSMGLFINLGTVYAILLKLNRRRAEYVQTSLLGFVGFQVASTRDLQFRSWKIGFSFE